MGNWFEGKTVLVAGAGGLAGSAIRRRVERENCTVLAPARRDLDLLDQAAVRRWMRAHRPEVVFLAAGKVGGILANKLYPSDFLAENLGINLNVIEAAHAVGVDKLVVLGSSCIYPREAPQPIRESALLTGSLEATNEAYAIAKIAAVKLAEAYARQYGDPFVSVMPTNLYGPNDNFDLETSHVLAALVRRFSEAGTTGAEEVVVWGTGRAQREFLHSDDLASACLLVAERCQGGEIINIGSGEELTIRELANLVARITGFQGRIVFDKSKPDGTLRKRLDVSAITALGWTPAIRLEDGIRQLHQHWLGTHDDNAIAALVGL